MLSFTVIEDDVSLPASDPHSSRISFPTCEDLGIPRDQAMTSSSTSPSPFDGTAEFSLESKADFSIFKINGLAYDAHNPKNPFSPLCRIPLPSPLGCYEYGMEPAFIRKRNERERERVKCVNEGYAKLRQHLPLENKEKRISKVETLRGAIRYIKHLQNLLLQGGQKENGRIEQNNNSGDGGSTAAGTKRKREDGESGEDEEEEEEEEEAEGSESSTTEEDTEEALRNRSGIKRLCTFDLGDEEFETDSE